ncbi:hypothetical protein BT96DRAFT_997237 [Gymnopus androsaceus JB14]|uniref:F-box domain-containing protein n=1 Tax=Gymnopus androsaceus JB14 TaxID=1447944 RepID=A0A6A4HDU2_9AGAR|nr:hypothetical protein BT96DRAFT_997237 [Gymnopus androsaceus JB14]
MPVEILSKILELSCTPKDEKFTTDYDVVTLCNTHLGFLKCVWLGEKSLIPTLKCGRNSASPCSVIEKSFWGLPLELYLDLSTDLQTDKVLIHQATKLLDCVLRFCCQIRLIEVSGDPESFIPLFSLPRASLPLLEKLDLHIADWNNTSDMLKLFPHGVEAFLGAPRLQHLSLTEPEVDSMLNKLVVVPLEQLTSLEITLDLPEIEFSLSVYQTALYYRCKSLVSLTMSLSDDVGLDVGFSKQFFYTVSRHPTRRDVVGFQNRSAAALALLTLALHCHLGSETEHITAELLGILVVFATVKSLRIKQAWSNWGYDETEVGEDVVPIYDVDAIVEAMIYTKSHEIFLPKLMNFELSVEHFPLKLMSVLSMIHSHWWTGKSKLDLHDIGIAQLQKVNYVDPFLE